MGRQTKIKTVLAWVALHEGLLGVSLHTLNDTIGVNPWPSHHNSSKELFYRPFPVLPTVPRLL